MGTVNLVSVTPKSLSIKDKKVDLAHLGGQVLLGREGLSERTEAMLDQVIQITCPGKR